jgi:glycosyltransferase involved in cell wall biosynthesis
MTLWALSAKFFGYTVPGWTSIVIPVYAFGGLQFMFLGIIGEYIGKIYIEIKKRPLYIIKESINCENSSD